ncbi:MAG TPA: hemolysin family protein [Bacteroidia bacterium]
MEILIILILTLLNGFFALSEIALVSVKKGRIENLASQGSSRAKIILKLLENPENFLSSVQVGITLIGIISGAYGGAALTGDLELYLNRFGFLQPYVHEISLAVVIGGITYFSIVIGELVPKSIAMNNAEAIALNCVPIIKYFTYATYPFVKLLSVSTMLILKILRIKDNTNEKISEEELLFMLKTAGKQGTLEKEESQVHQNLFYFTDQTAKSLMTGRSDVEWINFRESPAVICENLKESVHSKFLVCDGDIDNIKGITTAKRFFEAYNSKGFDLNEILHPPIFITQHTLAFEILNIFKSKKQYIGAVVDEFGVIRGIVTLHDLIEAIVGDLPDEDESDDVYIFKREDGSYLIDGKTPVYELNQYFQREVIVDNISKYTTVSGYILNQLKRLPAIGDKVSLYNFEMEIIDMDKLRIDKIMMVKKEPSVIKR